MNWDNSTHLLSKLAILSAFLKIREIRSITFLFRFTGATANQKPTGYVKFVRMLAKPPPLGISGWAGEPEFAHLTVNTPRLQHPVPAVFNSQVSSNIYFFWDLQLGLG